MTDKQKTLLKQGGFYVEKIFVSKSNAVLEKFICKKGDRNFNRFFYITKGVFYINDVTGTKIVATPGSVLYLPSDIEYQSYWDKTQEGAYYNISFCVYDKNKNPINFSESIVLAFKDINGNYYETFCKMYEDYINYDEFAIVKLQSELYRLFYPLLKSFELKAIKENKTSSEIYKAILYLNDNYMSDIKTDELAKMCNLSASVFRQCFKKYTNQTPMQYKTKLKMNHAKDMLESGIYTVSEIADIMNCSDLSHFNKLYQKEFKINPSESIPKTN